MKFTGLQVAICFNIIHALAHTVHKIETDIITVHNMQIDMKPSSSLHQSFVKNASKAKRFSAKCCHNTLNLHKQHKPLSIVENPKNKFAAE